MATNPSKYNWGTVSFADDPSQVKSSRPQLMKAGLWKPEWDQWFNFQGDPEAMTQGPAQPDFSSLAGYQVGHADYGAGNRRADLLGPNGQVVVDNPYFYDEPSMGKQFVQGAAIVGGAALGMNAAFGGLGAGAGSGLSGMDLAADAALGTGNNIVTAGSALGSGAGAGLASVAPGTSPGSGYWNGTNFSGTAPMAGSSTLGTGASAMSTFGDWVQLGGLVNSVFNRPDAPDTSGMNAAATANAAIAGRQQDLAEKQYTDQMALFNEFKPMLVQQMQTAITEQGKSTARADDQWSNYLTTFRPAEQALVQKSMEYATPGRQEQAAQEAAGGVAAQYDTARASSREDMIRAGLDPSAITSMEGSGRLLEAKDKAGAANTARRTVESQGLAYLDNAARFGRNMTSTGLAAAGLAGQQGAQASQGYGQLSAASAAPAAAAAPLFNSAVGANNSAGSLYGNIAGITAQSNLQDYNATMGTLAGLNKWANSGSGFFTSSKDTKHTKGRVKGAGDAVEDAKVLRWSYKPGLGDGDTKDRMGPMAEDLKRVAPEVSDGKRVDAIAMSGLHHAAIGDHNRAIRDLKKQVNRLEHRLSLADA